MFRIQIYKSQRILHMIENDVLIGTCPIGLGISPVGHKQEEGDGKTPEGVYFICTRNPQSRYTLFLGLSYPSLSDADLALARGAISAAQWSDIRSAHLNHVRPPWDTPLGGVVGIHGGAVIAGERLADDTAGCVVVSDNDIRLLWKLTDYGTPVTIFA